MPSSLAAPVLQVDANVIHKVDTTNAQNLCSMYLVFTKCKDSVSQGRRLENLTWRLLNRRCVDSPDSTVSNATSQPRDIQRSTRQSSAEDMPQLSGSVDSVPDDEEVVEFESESSEEDSGAVDIVRPHIRRQDSCVNSRSRRDRHITSDDLEKLVVSIVSQKEPLTAPLPEIPRSLSPPKPMKAPEERPELVRSGSTTTESPSKESERSDCSPAMSSPDLSSPKTTIIRGFSPSQLPRPIAAFSPPRPSSMADPIPAPTSSPAAKPVESKKPRAMFALGASSEDSYSDQAQSLETRNTSTLVPPKRKMFQIGGSSEEESSLKSALASPRNPLLNGQKKQTSFAKNVTTLPAPAVIDDDSSDYVDESAIDEEDSDWEDSPEDSGKSSIDDKTYFQRVDSKVNLPSRRSLITLMVSEQNQRRANLGNMASQSTSAIPHRSRALPNGLSMVASPNDSDEAPLMMKRATRNAPLRPINEVPRSSAQPIMVTTAQGTTHQAALSPRTTRRNMLSTELTESLRRQLLWERSQKTSTANAVLKRRHTSHDVANLKQYPERPYMNRANNDVNASSWDQDFTREAFSGYHSKGW